MLLLPVRFVIQTHTVTFDSRAVSLFIWGFLRRVQTLQVAQSFLLSLNSTEIKMLVCIHLHAKDPHVFAGMFI